jgi:hypothetical protein
MDSVKNIKKIWLGSLGFLDNCYINSIVVIILLLYCSTIFENINSFIGNLYNFSIIKLLVLLAIVYVTPKDPTIGILLGLSYIISINYLNNTENFKTSEENEHFERNAEKKENEHFFPLVNANYESDNKSNNNFHNNSIKKNENTCLDNYTPMNESVSDVCNPVATFKNELNAQGINDISGYRSSGSGSIGGSPV